MGGTVKNIGRGVAGGLTGGLSEIGQSNPFGGGIAGRGLEAGMTGGLSEFTQNNPFGAPINNPLASVFGHGPGSSNPYVSGPFSLDPNQVAGDRAAITAEGQKQYEQTLNEIPTSVSNAIQQENPQIMETLNKNHLLDSSAYPQEIARQQSILTQNLAEPALQGLQGFQSGALQRGLSMEDQINNANISKSIGQAFAPAPPSGKAQFGTAAQGVGSLAPWFAKGGALGK